MLSQVQLEVEGYVSGAYSGNSSPSELWGTVPGVQARTRVCAGLAAGPLVGLITVVESVGLVESACFIKIYRHCHAWGQGWPSAGALCCLQPSWQQVESSLAHLAQERHQLQGSQRQEWRPDRDTQDRSGCPVMGEGHGGRGWARSCYCRRKWKKPSRVWTRGAKGPVGQSPSLRGCLAGR